MSHKFDALVYPMLFIKTSSSQYADVRSSSAFVLIRTSVHLIGLATLNSHIHKYTCRFILATKKCILIIYHVHICTYMFYSNWIHIFIAPMSILARINKNIEKVYKI